MQKLIVVLIILLSLVPSIVSAKPHKGFHEGPYLRIVGGSVRAKFDNNARTGEQTAGDYEGTYGFQFGWNLWDTAAPELTVRYATKKTQAGKYEHIINTNLNLKYSLITDKLTDIGTLHILPFIQAGPSLLLAAVPGDRAVNSTKLFVWGAGAGAGFGVDFLFYQYVYFGITFQGEYLYIPSEYQIISGTREKIISGGWEPILGVTASAGVHF